MEDTTDKVEVERIPERKDSMAKAKWEHIVILKPSDCLNNLNYNSNFFPMEAFYSFDTRYLDLISKLRKWYQYLLDLHRNSVLSFGLASLESCISLVFQLMGCCF